MAAESIDKLYESMSEADLRIIERGTELLLLEYDLISELRNDRDLTQTELAEILDIRQSAISQIENQEDVLVKTLQRYVEALGGKLEILARFPDHAVNLRQFLTDSAGASRKHDLGTDADRFRVPEDFDAPLDNDVLDSFET